MDALTWLRNRSGFDGSLAAELSRALRMKARRSPSFSSPSMAVRGSSRRWPTALRSAAWIIADLKRGYDPAARCDEGTLAVILPGAPAAAAIRFAKRIVDDSRDLALVGLPRLTLSPAWPSSIAAKT